jgi:phosphoethanolamine N-methyltransferase
MQYAKENTRRYEAVFGRDFLSPGGLQTANSFCAAMGLRLCQRVLDIGSGLGGVAFHIAQTYGAHVLGIELEPGLVASSKERATAREITNAEFICGDVLNSPEGNASFDWIHSRDAFLHIADKPRLFQRAFNLLKPGGQLFFTDYGRGNEEPSEEFAAYTDAAGYHLHTAEDYTDLIAQAGFIDVRVDDRAQDLLIILQRDLERIADPLTPLSDDDRTYLTERWRLKQRACESGDMRWWHVRASKPR